jgi:hypothetical protein
VISPDLTLNDKSRQGFSGGLTGDNIGVEYAGVVFAIAESPKDAGLIWAGTNDGLVQITRDGGKNWTNVTKDIPNLPPWGTVSNIEPSRYDAGAAYITVDFHQVNNRDPFVYKTKGLRKDVAANHERNPKEHAELCTLRSRGSNPSRSAVSGYGKRTLRFVQRWRQLAAFAVELTSCSSLLDRGPGALQRSCNCHLRSWFLDS